MTFSLSLSVVLLSWLLTTAGAQPAPDTPPAPQATPDTQRLTRPAALSAPCEYYYRQEAGLPPLRANKLCSNHQGGAAVITKVQCVTDKGRLTFRPQLTGGGETSILAQPLVCTPEIAVGVLNGQPRLGTFAPTTRDCLGAACTIDFIVDGVEGATETTLTIIRTYE